MNPTMPMRRLSASHPPRGFTLVEVMIVVAIVGILAAIALPSYRAYVLRGQLSEAATLLSDFRVKMEQYYQDQKNYGAAACADAAPAPAWAAFPAGKYFTLGCALNADKQHFTLTATSAGTSLGTGAYVYSINQDAAQATTTYANASVALACWATRSATSCDN